MAKKILVCLDGSKYAEKILPYAIEQALCFGSKLILLRVCSSAIAVARASGSGPLFVNISVASEIAAQREVQEAEIYLSGKALELKDKGVDVDISTNVGLFTDSVLKFTRDNAIDLVAMTTHVYKGWKRLLRGSTVEDLLRESEVPLLVINPEAT
jgi:nucleotide-binding universal stress UspA family protein